MNVAVCVLPGTELSFAYEVKRSRLWPWSKNIIHHKTAILRQVNLDCPHAHHDALEFPDGEIVLLTYLMEGQQATVLQLPAAAVGSKAPQRAVYFTLDELLVTIKSEMVKLGPLIGLDPDQLLLLQGAENRSPVKVKPRLHRRSWRGRSRPTEYGGLVS
jgi:hypothetical protein